MTADPAAMASRPKPRVRLVVLDFDDTLYDWIGHFVPALDAMIRTAAPLLDVSETQLREELKAVHEHYGNTEHPFALLETRTTKARLGMLARDEQREALAPAFAAFDAVRARKLTLYDDVEPALRRLRGIGVPVAGYSAATSVNIAKRLKMLHLEPYFQAVYASPYEGLPYPGTRQPGEQTLPIIELEHPKPDPEAVTRIATDNRVPPSEALFLGDSVAGDIAPAILGGAQAAIVQRSSASTDRWLSNLLEVSHRRAETRADSATISDADLARVPIVTALTDLWEFFLFG